MLIRFVLQPQRQPQPQPPQSQSEHEQQKTESGEPETLQLLKRSTSTSVYVCVYECKLRNEYEGSELMPHNFFRFFCITQLNFYCHLIMKMTTMLVHSYVRRWKGIFVSTQKYRHASTRRLCSVLLALCRAVTICSTVITATDSLNTHLHIYICLNVLNSIKQTTSRNKSTVQKQEQSAIATKSYCKRCWKSDGSRIRAQMAVTQSKCSKYGLPMPWGATLQVENWRSHIHFRNPFQEIFECAMVLIIISAFSR